MNKLNEGDVIYYRYCNKVEIFTGTLRQVYTPPTDYKKLGSVFTSQKWKKYYLKKLKNMNTNEFIFDRHHILHTKLLGNKKP